MNNCIFFYDILNSPDFQDLDLNERFLKLKKMGISGFQIGDDEIFSVGEEVLLSALTQNGLRAEVIHVCPPLMNKDDAIFEGAVEQCIAAFDLLDRFSCKRMMVVPAPRSDVENASDRPRGQRRMAEGLRRIVSAAKPRDIEIYVENFSTLHAPFSTADDILYLLETFQ